MSRPVLAAVLVLAAIGWFAVRPTREGGREGVPVPPAVAAPPATGVGPDPGREPEATAGVAARGGVGCG